MSGSLFLMGLVPHWSAAGLAFIGISAMHSVVGPTSVVFQQEVVPFEWREVISGATTMAIGIGSSGISFSGGFILSAFGSRILFLSGAVSVAAGAALFWLFFRTRLLSLFFLFPLLFSPGVFLFSLFLRLPIHCPILLFL